MRYINLQSISLKMSSKKIHGDYENQDSIQVMNINPYKLVTNDPSLSPNILVNK